jgi:hypothetical protein
LSVDILFRPKKLCFCLFEVSRYAWPSLVSRPSSSVVNDRCWLPLLPY